MVRARAELGWACFIAYSLQAVAEDEEPGSIPVLTVETTELLGQREQVRVCRMESQKVQSGSLQRVLPGLWSSPYEER